MRLTASPYGPARSLRAVALAAALAAAGLASFGGPAHAETKLDLAQMTVADVPAHPSPTPHPSPFSYSAYFRSYDFTRLNNPQLSPKNALNQQSWNNAINLHGVYNIGAGLSVGATYLYAFPFAGDCNTAASHAYGLPCVKPNLQQPGQGTNPDDTLPGFILNTLYETYVQYKDPRWVARVGNQVIYTPWAGAIDTRLKPAAFQGADAAYNLNSNWSVEAMDMIRFEGRAESTFQNSTLLTATKIAGANYGGMPGNYQQPAYTYVPTPGFLLGRVGYNGGVGFDRKSAAISANLYYYNFVDIANALWFDGKYSMPGFLKPTFQLQLGTEHDSGTQVLGTIDSQIYGVQVGASPTSYLNFLAGVNVIPSKTTTMVLPSGVSCSSSGAIGGSVPFKYFLPAGGTPQCKNVGDGQTTIFYGGWVSPYTSGYTGDPLYSTTITTSMIDRASPGQAIQLQLTGYAFKKHVRMIARQGYYSFGTPVSGVAPTQEFDLDGTYCLAACPDSGPYHGLAIRYRYADRTQHFYTNNPDFKYNRAQLEYDFQP